MNPHDVIVLPPVPPTDTASTTSHHSTPPPQVKTPNTPPRQQKRLISDNVTTTTATPRNRTTSIDLSPTSSTMTTTSEQLSTVRVVARIRPLPLDQPRCVTCDANGIRHIPNTTDNSDETRDFSFDATFAESATQQLVYEETCGGIVNEIISGFNATILAYGQTGSGKSYTMMGPGFLDSQQLGIIPRLSVDLFKSLEQLDRADKVTLEITVRVTFVEIFLERIIDLLAEPNSSNSSHQHHHNSGVRIRESVNGKVMLDGAREVFCTTADEVLDVLRRGNAMRSVGATRMNTDSSRSHSIFSMQVEQVERGGKGDIISSKLVLVDLAGSESVKRSGAAGDRLEEAKSINQSLSALGNVINALTEKRSHIPYRDAKLTRMLEDSLGGSAKTCLIITLSPSMENAFETLSTLRFGQRAKRVANRAVRNIRRSNEELERLLAQAEHRIMELLGGVVTVSSISTATTTTTELETKLEEMSIKLDDVSTNLVISNEALSTARNEIVKLNEEKRTLNETLLRLEERISESALANKRLQVELRSKDNELNSMRDENGLLVKELETRQVSNDVVVDKPAVPAVTMHPPYPPLRRTASFPPCSSSSRQQNQQQEPLDLSVSRRKSLRDSDVRLLTAKCVNLQLALFEKEDELELVKSKSGNSQLWSRVTKMTEEAHVLTQQLRAASSSLEMMQRRHEAAMTSRQEHIDMLENALLDFQTAFRSRVETHQKIEAESQTKIATLTDLLAALSVTPTNNNPSPSRVVTKPMLVKARVGGTTTTTTPQSLPAPARGDNEITEQQQQQHALVPFKLHDPATSQLHLKSLPERTFWFGSNKLVIKQHWKPDGKGGTELGFGAAVYPACLMLCDYIGTRNPTKFVGKRVLELGCGLALVSLVAKVSGGASFVLATDGDGLTVSHAFENITRNGFSSEEIGTAIFRWGDENKLQSLIKTWTGDYGFDVIVASDVVAVPYAEALTDLVRTLSFLATIRPTMEVLLTYTRRHASEEVFFAMMKKEGFDMQHVHDVAPEFVSGGGYDTSASASLLSEEMQLLRFVKMAVVQ